MTGTSAGRAGTATLRARWGWDVAGRGTPTRHRGRSRGPFRGGRLRPDLVAHRGGALDDVVRQRAQTFDLDMDDVARLDRSRDGGRARENDVTRHQRDEPRDVGDEIVHVPGHLVGRTVLAHVFADQCEHPLVLEVPVGDYARSDRAKRVGTFDAKHRAGVGVAKVVQSEVVGDGVAGDVVPGVVVSDIAGRSSDDDRDLAFEVEVVAVGRTHDGTAVGVQRRDGFVEVRRRGW